MRSNANVASKTSGAAPRHKIFKGNASSRRLEIIEAAATLFRERGFRATSMRDIAGQVGMLSGSLYHHFHSKEELFLEVHDLALQSAADLIAEAVADHADPWERLEAASIRLLEIQLDLNSVTMPLMNDFRAAPAEMRTRLVAKRDEFELIFASLVRDLPLDPRVDRRILRILLLSLLNNVGAWFVEGRLTAAEIGRQIVAIFRHGADRPAPPQP